MRAHARSPPPARYAGAGARSPADSVGSASPEPRGDPGDGFGALAGGGACGKHNGELWSGTRQGGVEDGRGADVGGLKTPAPVGARQPPDTSLLALSASPAGMQPHQAQWTPAAVGLAEATAPCHTHAESYMTGATAALTKAFQLSLPSQQALGQLDGQVRRLETSHGDAAMRLSALENTLAVLHERVAQLRDASKIPAGTNDSAAAAAASAATASALAELTEVVREQVALNEARSAPVVHQVAAVLGAAVRNLTSQAGKLDIALVFLSRKVLLGTRPLGDGEDRRKRSATRQALGALFFIAAIEGSWQAYDAAIRRVPRAVRRAAGPVETGLRVTRGVTWAAAAVLAVDGLRSWCAQQAESWVRSSREE